LLFYANCCIITKHLFFLEKGGVNMTDSTLSIITNKVVDITNIYAGYVKKAECRGISVLQAAGKENLKDLENEIDDVLTILLNDFSQDKRTNLYNQMVVVMNAVNSALLDDF